MLLCGVGCEMRSDEALFFDAFGFHYPKTWHVVSRYKNESIPQMFYYEFEVMPSELDLWVPEPNGSVRGSR